MFSRDIFHEVLDYLKFKDTRHLILINDQFYKWWSTWQCREIITLKINRKIGKIDMNICYKYLFFKFRIWYLKQFPKNTPDNVYELNLSGVKMEQLRNFKVNKHLHTLNIQFSYGELDNIDWFDVKNLHTFQLYSINLKNISGFDVKKLHTLDLSRTLVTDIRNLNLKNLHTLILYRTDILVDGIEGLDIKNLQYLDLSMSRISYHSIKDCEFFKNLNRVNFEHIGTFCKGVKI